ncbi:MAG: hypothetical protein KDE19_11920 [Caldilineaceae bacterium]|nr:hypothetical protein [Caldilineaceae bacterium]
MKLQHRTEHQPTPQIQELGDRQMHYRFHRGTPDFYPSSVPWPAMQSRRPQAVVHVLLTLTHLDPETLEPLDRGERYRRLMEHATAQRQCIEAWLAEQHLLTEVMRLGDPNTFNLLFVSCTPHVAERLQDAPGVVDVAIAKVR